MTSKGERRTHFRGRSRAGRRVDVRYRESNSDGEGTRAVTADLGVGGAFVQTSSPPEVGTQLILVVELPGAALPLELAAEVRWLSTAPDRLGMGIKFAPLDVDALRTLRDYFATLNS